MTDDRNHNVFPRRAPAQRAPRRIAAAIMLGTLCAAAAPGAECVNDQLWVANARVRCAAVVDDTLYIGGDFTHVGPPTGFGAAIDADTAVVDLTWPRVNGVIYAVAGDGHGGFYVGGAFTVVGGRPRANLAHLLADGSLDPHWAPAANSRVYTLAVLGDTVYVGGEFTTVAGTPRAHMAAISAAGELLPFNAAAGGDVRAIVTHNGRLFVGGTFASIGGAPRGGLAELDPLTGQALALNLGGNPSVLALAADGTTLYVGGAFSTLGGQTRNHVAAVSMNTGTALPWNPNSNGYVRSLAVSGSTVFIGGTLSMMGGQTRLGLAAVNNTTGALLPFNAQLGTNLVMAIVPDGARVLIGGGFESVGGQPRYRLAAVDAVTGAALGWRADAGDDVNALALQGNTLYAGGYAGTYGAVVRQQIAALDLATGEPTSFDPGDYGSVTAITPSDTGTLYVAGGFVEMGGAYRPYLAEIDAVTGAPTSWQPPEFFPPSIYGITYSADTVYVGGEFDEVYGGPYRYSLAAVTRSTGALLPWDPVANYFVYDVLYHHGVVYAAGGFTNVGGANRRAFAALDPISGQATAFDLNLTADSNARVDEMQLVGDTLYFVGDFDTVAGQPRGSGAAYDLATSSLLPWNPACSQAYSLALADGVAYIGGPDMRFGGVVRNFAAAVDAGTGALLGWDPAPFSVLEGGLYATGFVHTAVAHGGYVYLGGDFVDIAGSSGHGYIAAVRRLGLSPADLNADGDVDIEDFDLLADCLSGPDVVPTPACTCSDQDGDTDTDLGDFAAFQQTFVGA